MANQRNKSRVAAIGGGLMTIAGLLALIEALWSLGNSEPLIPVAYNYFSDFLPILPRFFVIGIWATISGAGIFLVVNVFRVTGKSQELQAIQQEVLPQLGLFDYQVQGPKALDEIGRLLKKANNSTHRVGRQMQRHTRRLQSANGKPQSLQKIAREAARDIHEHERQLAEVIPQIEKAEEVYTTSYIGTIEWLEQYGESKQQEWIGLFQAAEELDMTLRETIRSLSTYTQTISGLKRRNISGDLNVACDGLAATMDRLISVMEAIRATAQQIASRKPGLHANELPTSS